MTPSTQSATWESIQHRRITWRVMLPPKSILKLSVSMISFWFTAMRTTMFTTSSRWSSRELWNWKIFNLSSWAIRTKRIASLDHKDISITQWIVSGTNASKYKTNSGCFCSHLSRSSLHFCYFFSLNFKDSIESSNVFIIPMHSHFERGGDINVKNNKIVSLHILVSFQQMCLLFSTFQIGVCLQYHQLYVRIGEQKHCWQKSNFSFHGSLMLQ